MKIVDVVSEIWPNIAWTTEVRPDDTLWILGQHDGRHTWRHIGYRPLASSSREALMQEMSAACQSIADELCPPVPEFIDWELVS